MFLHSMVIPLILFIGLILLLIYISYHLIIREYCFGKKLLRVALRRKKLPIDAILLSGIFAIWLWSQSETLSKFTLIIFIMFNIGGFYLYFIHFSPLLFKSQGFFYNTQFIKYQEIKNLGLTKNNTLTIDLTDKTLCIPVKNSDDFEKIANLMLNI